MLLATGFGLGLSPVASGTVGCLLGVGIVVAIAPLAWYWQACIAVALVLAAIPICGAAEKQFEEKDDGRIVADEYLTFPLCLLGIAWIAKPWFLVIAFVVNRALDIVKPPPAWQAQKIRGGVGVVADDVISSLYALGVNHLIWILVNR